MGQVVGALGGADLFDDAADRTRQRFACARRQPTKQGLELGEQPLDRVEVRGIGRQEQKAGTLRSDGFADPGHFVASEVVGHADVAGRQRGGEELFDPGQKCRSINGALQHQGRDDPVVAQPGKEGGGLPVPVRHPADHPDPARRAAMEPSHVGLGPGLVEKHQAAHV